MLSSSYKIIALLWVFPALLSFSSSFAADNNIVILDSLLNQTTKKICIELTSQNLFEADLFISDHPAKSLLINKILAENNCGSIKYSIPSNQNSVTKSALTINIIDISVKYQLMSDNKDSITRNIGVIYSATLNKINGSAVALSDTRLSYTDVFSRKDAENLANIDGGFANPKVPMAKPSFWDDVAEPAIIISSTVLTLFLLFTVRSN